MKDLDFFENFNFYTVWQKPKNTPKKSRYDILPHLPKLGKEIPCQPIDLGHIVVIIDLIVIVRKLKLDVVYDLLDSVDGLFAVNDRRQIAQSVPFEFRRKTRFRNGRHFEF